MAHTVISSGHRDLRAQERADLLDKAPAGDDQCFLCTEDIEELRKPGFDAPRAVLHALECVGPGVEALHVRGLVLCRV